VLDFILLGLVNLHKLLLDLEAVLNFVVALFGMVYVVLLLLFLCLKFFCFFCLVVTLLLVLFLFLIFVLCLYVTKIQFSAGGSNQVELP